MFGLRVSETNGQGDAKYDNLGIILKHQNNVIYCYMNNLYLPSISTNCFLILMKYEGVITSSEMSLNAKKVILRESASLRFVNISNTL